MKCVVYRCVIVVRSGPGTQVIISICIHTCYVGWAEGKRTGYYLPSDSVCSAYFKGGTYFFAMKYLAMEGYPLPFHLIYRQ